MLILLELGQNQIPIEIPDNDTMIDLSQIIQMETNIKIENQHLNFNNIPLTLNTSTIASQGLQDGSTIKGPTFYNHILNYLSY
jgi:hypothetical protein